VRLAADVSSSAEPRDVVITDGGAAVVVGTMYGDVTVEHTGGSTLLSSAGDAVFALELTAGGALAWAKVFPGSGYVEVAGVAARAGGGAILA